MPLLAGLLQSLFGGLAAFLAGEASKRATMALLVSTGLVLASAALLTAFNLAVKPLVAAMFSTQFGQFIGLAFPPIAGNCLAAIGGTWAACGAYKLKVVSIRASAGL